MGTNFYLTPEAICELHGLDADAARGLDDLDPLRHLGKRSAAGPYCWDCDMTLCLGGPSAVHSGVGFHSKCPRCGGKPKGIPQAVRLELGFAEPNQERPTGVTSASSFGWAHDPVTATLYLLGAGAAREVVESEYGERLTGAAFIDMLEKQCPLRRYGSVGQQFS